jgi:hypothetical protein
MAAPTPLTWHSAILPPETCTPRPCLPSIEAKRRGQAERSGEGSFPDYGNLTCTHAEEGQAERSGQDERSREEGVGVSLDYDTTQHAYAQKKYKLSGQAERSGKRGFRGSPPTTAIQLARTPKKTKPSAGARPIAAKKRGFRGYMGSTPKTRIRTRT